MVLQIKRKQFEVVVVLKITNEGNDGMIRLMMAALFLLAVAVVSGCSTVESIRDVIIGIQRPRPNQEEVLRCIQSFEKGRRAESQRDCRTAATEYDNLIKQGNRYGEYGRAMQLLRSEPEPGSEEALKAVRYLVACAERSSHMSKYYPDSAMDSAFSAAAMAKLSVLAQSEHDNQDIADWLRGTMSGIVTEEVKRWANAMKTNNVDSAKIYEDVISVVESCRESHEYVKEFTWDGIRKEFLNKEPGSGTPEKTWRPPKSQDSMVKFDKVPGATFQYDFEFQLSGNGRIEEDLKEVDKILSMIRRRIKKEFRAENPSVGVDDVRTSINWKREGSRMTGSAVAKKGSATWVVFDNRQGSGTVAVLIDGGNVDAARDRAREQINELVSRRNVWFTKESQTEDGLLEICFTTHDPSLE